jgi:hypothetical protein
MSLAPFADSRTPFAEEAMTGGRRRPYVAAMIRWMEDVETSGPLVVARGVLAMVVLVLVAALNDDVVDVVRQVVFAWIRTSVGF